MFLEWVLDNFSYIYFGAIPIIGFAFMVLYQLGFDVLGFDDDFSRPVLDTFSICLLWPMFLAIIVSLVIYCLLWEAEKLITGYKDDEDE